MRTASKRQRLALLITASLAAHGLTLAAVVQRPPPLPPRLTVAFGGEGSGVVLIEVNGMVARRCAANDVAHCVVDVPGKDARVRLLAHPEADMVFAGYETWPMRPPPALRDYLGDPLWRCDAEPDLFAPSAWLATLAAWPQPAIVDPLDCDVAVRADAEIVAYFDRKPDSQDVALLEPPVAEPPAPKATPKRPPALPKLAAPPELKPPVVVALKPPVLVPPPPPPPPPAPAQAPPPPPPPPPMPKENMRMVEVTADHEVAKAPDDATHLSDKNRDVAEETHAKETNLDKELAGQATPSAKSDDRTSAEIGGPEAQIRQTETTEATSTERLAASDHSGHAHEAKGLKVGEAGQAGQEGKGATATPGILAMRGVGGRGAITKVTTSGDGKVTGKKGLPGVDTSLSFEQYQRIMGQERTDAERELAARRMSAKKGRWEQKLDAMRSALENFTPDVKPGNQTALKTRAHPFAVYVARMHRRIHELWGFGFLEDLDSKPSDSRMNNFDLWTNVELAINPDGSIHKTTIVHASGVLEFDVAAVHTVQAAAPYEPTPEVIRSPDGRVYLRWGFYRNWKQCGTFNVEPFILSEAPAGSTVADGAALAGAVVGAPPLAKELPVGPSTNVTNAKAIFAANMLVTGYATVQIDKMIEQLALPFTVGDRALASAAELKPALGQLVAELGALRSWHLWTAAEYAARTMSQVPAGGAAYVVLEVTAAKGGFAVLLAPQGGAYKGVQLVR